MTASHIVYSIMLTATHVYTHICTSCTCKWMAYSLQATKESAEISLAHAVYPSHMYIRSKLWTILITKIPAVRIDKHPTERIVLIGQLWPRKGCDKFKIICILTRVVFVRPVCQKKNYHNLFRLSIFLLKYIVRFAYDLLKRFIIYM